MGPQGVPSPTQHIPSDTDATSVFLRLVSSRYEESSFIVSSNKSSSAWPEISWRSRRRRSHGWPPHPHHHLQTRQVSTRGEHDELATTNATQRTAQDSTVAGYLTVGVSW